MTRLVEELRRESERSRAELAATVDQLRARISDTAEDIRHKVSPQHIKSEVSDYISHKTQSWVEALKQQAMENPMQAIAAGTAIEVSFRKAPQRYWWPVGLGTPSSVGAQNDLRYAVFPRRLVIKDGEHIEIYDTGDHRISGIAQAQSADQTLTFTSQDGLVRVSDLRKV